MGSKRVRIFKLLLNFLNVNYIIKRVYARIKKTCEIDALPKFEFEFRKAKFNSEITQLGNRRE